MQMRTCHLMTEVLIFVLAIWLSLHISPNKHQQILSYATSSSAQHSDVLYVKYCHELIH